MNWTHNTHNKTRERLRYNFTIFTINLSFFFFNLLKNFKSSITPLIFAFITYYYFAKKRPLFFKANFIYIFFIIFVTLFFFFFSLTLCFWNSKLYSRFLTFAFCYLLSICTYIFFIIFVSLFFILFLFSFSSFL